MTPEESIQDMLEGLRRRREAVDARVVPFQAELQPGDHYLIHYPDEELIVYGEILDPIETARTAGCDEDELEYLRERYAAPELCHFRVVREYSPTHPEGAVVDIHVSWVQARLTLQQFQIAKEGCWPQHARFITQLLGADQESPQ
jgi:hypothetical protein